MKKEFEQLNEKMTVKLPDELSKENILSKLDKSVSENIVDIPLQRKNRGNTAKKLIPIAASLAVVMGITAVFGTLNRDKISPNNEKIPVISDVSVYENYNEIYSKFKEMQKYYIAEPGSSNDGAANFAATGSGAVPKDDFEKLESDSNASPSFSTDTEDKSLSQAEELREHGETNVQEQGVDEADVIKTDGRYIYTVRTKYDGKNDRGYFTVTDCSGDKMNTVSETKLDETANISEMYIKGNYAVFVSNCFSDTVSKLYSFDSCCGVVYGDTKVAVYDISDKSAPKKITDYTQSGSLYSTRMVGSTLYCVSTYYVDLNNKNIKDICIPKIESDDNTRCVPAGNISVIDGSQSPSYAVITTLDIENSTEPTSNAVLGSCDNLYATQENMFVAETNYNASGEITKIYKFDCTQNGVEFKSKAVLSGYLHNQFSMSYYNGYLRVATTKDNTIVTAEKNGDLEVTVSSSAVPNTTNTLYILNSDMEEVGKIENIAKNERIESARFIGNTAYIVTFMRTDPLFVIDVSDPKNPKITGEAKVPGFSSYLHPVSDGLLIGIGDDGDNTGVNGDQKVALFNVSDPKNPYEVNKLPVLNGAGYVNCGLSYNHKLFVSLPNGEFAVPFNAEKFVGKGSSSNESLVIRYRISDGKVEEVARYSLGSGENYVIGGTYIGNTLYIFCSASHQKYNLVSIDLETNTQTGKLELV